MSATTERDAEEKLTASQAADLLDVSVQTVTRMIQRGDLEASKVGSGQNERWQISPREVWRELVRDEVRGETVRAGFEWFMGQYYGLLQNVIDQAEQVKALRADQFDWEASGSDRGDALEHFEKLDGAVAELANRVRALHGLRGAFPAILTMMEDPSDLEGEDH